MKISKLYRAHLASAAWKIFAAQVRARDGNRCVTCDSDNSERLEVHHRTYERLGCENLSDCYTLCRACHRLITCRIRRLRNRAKVLPPLTNVVAATAMEGRSLSIRRPRTLPLLQNTHVATSGGFALLTHTKDIPNASDCQVPAYGGQSSPASQWTTRRSVERFCACLEGSYGQTE